MQAVNLTLEPVELDPVNGPGLLAPAIPESDGAHVRELKEVTRRESDLSDAGVIALEGEASSDRYDALDREALQTEADGRGLTVAREDGRDDLPPTANELRPALRAADANPGGDLS